MMRTVTRALFVFTMTALVLTGSAQSAFAHGSGGADASNYDSSVTGILGRDGSGAELPQGLSWRVVANDALLEVTNDTDEELVVAGYEDEPYLRIDRDGVWMNRNSPAAYLNEDRYAQTPVPDYASADAEPEWVRQSDGNRFAWHDHRIHWMAPSLPPRVRAAPGQTTTISNWEVPFSWDNQQLAVQGTLQWVPPSPWWPWIAAALTVVSLPVVAVLMLRTGPNRRLVMLRVAAAVLAVAIGLDVIHAFDDLIAVPATWSENLYAGFQSAIFILVGSFCARATWRGRDGATTALGIGAGALLLGVGLTHLNTLTSSQIATVLPEWFARAVTAINLVLVAPAAIAIASSGDLRSPSHAERTTGAPVAEDA